jgi:hypothetical protein
MVAGIKLKGSPNQPLPGYMDGFYRAGNQYAKKERLTPEAHKVRTAALYRGWTTNAKRHTGEKFVTKNSKRKEAKRIRRRLYTTVAKEAREIQDKSRRAAEKIVERMVEIAATSFNETAAIAAANLILDRAYGKANQTNITATVDANGKPTEVSGKELDTRIAQALKRIEELAGRTPKAPESKDKPVDVRQFDRDPDSPTQH